MSGITPLLDTLLHQVLGKRIDTAPPRDLTEPVRPVAPGEGPRALQSDSRLEGQRPAATPLPGAPTTTTREQGQLLRGDTPPAPASTQTHFSPSARTIADVLLRFPAPPSVLSTAAPLMTAGEPPSATALAERLQANVRDSGLFYESHLARWYRGDMNRQQLEREPQMLNTPRAAPPTPGATLPPTSGLLRGETALPTAATLPGQAATSQSPAAHAASRYVATEALYAPAARGAAPTTNGEVVANEARAEGREAAAREGGGASLLARSTGSEPVHDSLQGVVRHQLELLVTPVLRWEGDIWSGIFMALMVHLPAAAQREGDASAEEEQKKQQQETWHSEIRLTVPQLGEIHAALWLQERGLQDRGLQERGLQERGLQERGLQERSVRLQLQSQDESALEALRAGVPQLEQRLHNAGLTQVLVDVRALSGEEEGRGDAGIEA